MFVNEFQIPTTEAEKALHAAKSILTWLDRDEPHDKSLYNAYLKYIFSIWTSVPPENGHIREEVWTRFSLFCASTEYTNFWSQIHMQAGLTEVSPTLSFYVTFNMFTDHWMNTYPVHHKLQDPSQPTNEPLTHDEESALWYVGGYLIKSVSDKIIKTHTTFSIDLLLILETFKENDEIDDTMENDLDMESQPTIDSKEWFHSINRGGLTRCTEDFFLFIRCVEQQMKNTLQATYEKTVKTSEILLKMKEEATVRLAWKELTSNIEDEYLSSLLLDKILTHYIEFRVFAFTKKTIEKYKKEKGKYTEKSKSLRNKIQNEL